MLPPTIPPTTTDVMPLETETGTATLVSCIVAIEYFSVPMRAVVSDTLGISGVVDEGIVMLTAAVVDERVVETLGHESAFSSVHINC